MLEFFASPEWGLAGLFLASFLAATLLPGGSEVVLFAVVRAQPETALPALAIATVGNTLGGMSSYFMGRLIKQQTLPARTAWVARYGSLALLLSWVPLIGDALCVAAGWLRANWLACALWMSIGKGARYAAVLGIEHLI